MTISEFEIIYCKACGSQRCASPTTTPEFAEGCTDYKLLCNYDNNRRRS